MNQALISLIKTSWIVLCFFFSSTISYGQTYIGDEAEIEQILANIKQFSAHVMAGEDEKISECYTEDAKIFPNRVKIIEGKEAIRKYWEPSAGYQTIHHKITPSEIKINGEEAYDYGYYEGATRNPQGEESTWGGKYVIVWRKVEGQWKMYLDIWNSVVD